MHVALVDIENAGQTKACAWCYWTSKDEWVVRETFLGEREGAGATGLAVVI